MKRKIIMFERFSDLTILPHLPNIKFQKKTQLACEESLINSQWILDFDLPGGQKHDYNNNSTLYLL